MDTQTKKVLIAGGYGHVGSNVARLIRKEYPFIKLILAGRNPENGYDLCKELGNAEAKYLDISSDINLQDFGDIDLIIAAMQDHGNVLHEAAIKNDAAHISITRLAEDVSPLLFLSLHKTLKAPIVLSGHWQAGILIIGVAKAAGQFKSIDRVTTSALYDQLDPVGPMVTAQLSGFVARALIRQSGKWQFVDAKANARQFTLQDGSAAVGYPLGSLDIPSIAALTDAPNIRFDIAIGSSIGTLKGLQASHDLYIDIEGELFSGNQGKTRMVISDPQGQSHLTALGVFLAVEGIFGLGGQSAPEKGGIFLPETLLSVNRAVARLNDFGIIVTENQQI